MHEKEKHIKQNLQKRRKKKKEKYCNCIAVNVIIIVFFTGMWPTEEVHEAIMSKAIEFLIIKCSFFYLYCKMWWKKQAKSTKLGNTYSVQDLKVIRCYSNNSEVIHRMIHVNEYSFVNWSRSLTNEVYFIVVKPTAVLFSWLFRAEIIRITTTIKTFFLIRDPCIPGIHVSTSANHRRGGAESTGPHCPGACGPGW